MNKGAKLKKSLRFLKGQITKAENRAKNMTGLTVYSLKHFLDELKSDYDEFESYFVGELSDEEALEDFEEYEDKYNNAVALLQEEIDKRLDRKPGDNMNTSGGSDRLMSSILERQRELTESIGRLVNEMPRSRENRLPALRIPVFSGNWKDWNLFKSLFTNRVIENVGLNNEERFGHLLTLVNGEAAMLIRHIPIREDSFEMAWRLLMSKYDKPYKLANGLIGEVVRAAPMKSKHSVHGLFNCISESLSALDSMGEYCRSRDPWIIHLMVNKLDDELKEKWAHEIANVDEPNLKRFMEFLSEEDDALITVGGSDSNPIEKERVGKLVSKSVKANATTSMVCFVCNNNHKIFECEKFKTLSVKARIELARNKNRCLNCLGTGHFVGKCESKSKCIKCGRKHHSLLHYEYYYPPSKQPQSGSKPDEHDRSNDPLVKVNSSTGLETNILPTAIVEVLNDCNRFVKYRALLDSGSQTSFITERCLKELGLKRSRQGITFVTLSSNQSKNSRGSAGIVFRSIHDENSIFSTTTFVVNRITGLLPSNRRVFASKNRLDRQFQLADSKFDEPAEIDILLGADLLFSIIKSQKYYHEIDKLWIIESQLGWLVSGGTSYELSEAKVNCNFMVGNESNLNELVNRFWSLEEPITTIKPREEEVYCEKLYIDTTKRLENGRYSVSLPFRSDAGDLGDSYPQARSRFISLERRFDSDENFKTEYCKLMRHFESEGFIEKIQESDPKVDGRTFYLPHHGVGMNGSKLRIVFDASMKSSNGLSLNDVLHTGPNLQTDIRNLLIDFRFCKYVMVADVIKMYRQIFINRDSRDAQRFLWRENRDSELQEYRIITVTDGLSCSPFLALRTMNQLALDEESNFPKASEYLSKRYMDDFFIGNNSMRELIDIRNQLIGILKSAKMGLGKWCANVEAVLADLPRETIATQGQKEIKAHETIKTLGVIWDYQNDCFTFAPYMEKPSKLSKRSLLSDSARLYDPLGWITPVTVALKIIFQETCLRKLDWDDHLPEDIIFKWLSIRDEIGRLSDVRIPRWLGIEEGVEFHGFCDASCKAYACVVYSRIRESNGSIVVRLIMAKSKIAPMKPMSIARLELCAANLLAESIKFLSDICKRFGPKLHCWTDSTTVLAWLSDHPSRWKSFVANRCANIHELIPNVEWRYIKSQNNPADIASRGTVPEILMNNSVWWFGPSCLSDEVIFREKYSRSKTDLEVRVPVEGCFVVGVSDFWDELLKRYSSINKAIHVMAYVRRIFKSNAAKPASIDLTCAEVQESFDLMLRMLQMIHFGREISDIRMKGCVGSKSKLSPLDPILDDKGLIRAGGRIKNAPIGYNMKFPIILPKSLFLTNLIRHFHMKFYHADRKLLVTLLRQRFWISRVQNEVKGVIRRCKKCQIMKAMAYAPKMGPLPEYRLKPRKPFSITGVDYAGPVMIRAFKCRGKLTVKGYIALFICMVTKAIHLELVFGLDTESLINALKRFVARRGRCEQLLSDNGTNFVSCKNNLLLLKNKVLQCVNDSCFKKFLLDELIEWKMIPPGTPHMGGLWEAGVRSVKSLLAKRFETLTPTIEEFSTALAEIESVLNSRPLFAMNNEDIVELVTPSHLINGFPTTMIPDGYVTDQGIELTLSKRYHHIREVVRNFWREWSKYYFDEMRKLYKWKRDGRGPKIDDIVLIRKSNAPPSCWPKGRVIEIYPGSDGIIRTVRVKTSDGQGNHACRNLVPMCFEA